MKKTKFILPLLFITPAVASVPMLLQTSCSENKEEAPLEISFDDIPASCIVESGTPVYYKHGESNSGFNSLLDLRAYAEYKQYEGSHFSIAKDESLSLGLLIDFDQNVTLVSGSFDINNTTTGSAVGIAVGSTTNPAEGTEYSGHLTIEQNVYFSINVTYSEGAVYGVYIKGDCNSEASVVNHGVFNISSSGLIATGVYFGGSASTTTGCNFENTGILSIKSSRASGYAYGVWLGVTHSRIVKINGYIGIEAASEGSNVTAVNSGEIYGSDIQLGAICEINVSQGTCFSLGDLYQEESTQQGPSIAYNCITAINGSLAGILSIGDVKGNSNAIISLAGDALTVGSTGTMAVVSSDWNAEDSILEGVPKFYSNKDDAVSNWTKATTDNNGANQKYYYNTSLIDSSSGSTGIGDTTLDANKLEPQDNPLFAYTLQSGLGKNNYNSAIKKALNDYKGKLSNDCIGKGWISDLIKLI